MNKSILLCLLLSFSNVCFSQIDHIKVLIGHTDAEVSQYLDSLNSLKNDPYSKIKKDVTAGGDLVLENDFATDDESYYNCNFLGFIFARYHGIEICVREFISGSVEYAESNLNYIQDNFIFISPNNWEFSYRITNGVMFKTIATFKRFEGQYPTYTILYEAQSLR